MGTYSVPMDTSTTQMRVPCKQSCSVLCPRFPGRYSGMPTVLQSIRWELSEDVRVNFLRKRYLKLNDEVFEYAVNQCKAADPTNGKYLAWIFKLERLGTVTFPEDTEKVRTRLAEFDQLKKKQGFNGEKDINKYATYSQLAQVVRANSEVKTKGEIKRELAVEGAELLNEQDGFRLYRITTCEAGLALGWRTTEWCVKDPKYFNQYGPPFYYIMEEHEGAEFETQWYPHQLLKMDPERTQCMDVLDHPADPGLFIKMGVDFDEMMEDTRFCLKWVQQHKQRVEKLEQKILSDEEIREYTGVSYAKVIFPNGWPELEEKLVNDVENGVHCIDMADSAMRYFINTQSKIEWPEFRAALERVINYRRTAPSERREMSRVMDMYDSTVRFCRI